MKYESLCELTELKTPYSSGHNALDYLTSSFCVKLDEEFGSNYHSQTVIVLTLLDSLKERQRYQHTGKIYE